MTRVQPPHHRPKAQADTSADDRGGRGGPRGGVVDRRSDQRRGERFATSWSARTGLMGRGRASRCSRPPRRWVRRCIRSTLPMLRRREPPSMRRLRRSRAPPRRIWWTSRISASRRPQPGTAHSCRTVFNSRAAAVTRSRAKCHAGDDAVGGCGVGRRRAVSPQSERSKAGDGAIGTLDGVFRTIRGVSHQQFRKWSTYAATLGSGGCSNLVRTLRANHGARPSLGAEVGGDLCPPEPGADQRRAESDHDDDHDLYDASAPLDHDDDHHDAGRARNDDEHLFDHDDHDARSRRRRPRSRSRRSRPDQSCHRRAPSRPTWSSPTPATRRFGE